MACVTVYSTQTNALAPGDRGGDPAHLWDDADALPVSAPGVVCQITR